MARTDFIKCEGCGETLVMLENRPDGIWRVAHEDHQAFLARHRDCRERVTAGDYITPHRRDD